MSKTIEAAELADALIDNAIQTLRRKPQLQQLSVHEWELFLANVREEWMRWLPDYLDDVEREGDDD